MRAATSYLDGPLGLAALYVLLDQCSAITKTVTTEGEVLPCPISQLEHVLYSFIFNHCSLAAAILIGYLPTFYCLLLQDRTHLIFAADQLAALLGALTGYSRLVFLPRCYGCYYFGLFRHLACVHL